MLNAVQIPEKVKLINPPITAATALGRNLRKHFKSRLLKITLSDPSKYSPNNIRHKVKTE